VPLSEHEQRVLEQIERSLYADDPKFAATVRGIDPRAHHRRRYVRAAIGLVLGIALLPVGIAISQLAVSVAGFLLALLAFMYGVATWRQVAERADGKPAAAAGTVKPGDLHVRRGRSKKLARRGPKRTVMERFEERWNRRRDGYGQ
jgi:hypothetical protein